ncbi:MAG: peptidoglycan-binding protein [Cyanobacteria bacterium P01_E01_bin.42]
MDALNCAYSYDSYEKTEGIEYDFIGETWCRTKLPSSAWLAFLSAIVLCGILSGAKPALAELYVNTPNVNTPNGGCLRARRGPSTGSMIYTCVRNGARLKDPINYSNNGWIQLSSGNWVYGAHTSTSLSGRRGWREIGTTVRVRPGAIGPDQGGSGLVLSIGSQGNLVVRLQTRLRELGYTSVGAVDGKYGIRTRNAIRNLQRNRGLAIDGVVGPQTLREMGLGI